MLAHQKEFALGEDSWMALVLELEGVAKFFQRVAIFSKDQKEIYAVLNVFVDLIEPAVHIGIDR